MESVESSAKSFVGKCRSGEYKWRLFEGAVRPPGPRSGDIWVGSRDKPAAYWDGTQWVVEETGKHHHFPEEDGSRNSNVWLWKGRWQERTTVSRHIAKWQLERNRDASTATASPLGSEGADSDPGPGSSRQLDSEAGGSNNFSDRVAVSEAASQGIEPEPARNGLERTVTSGPTALCDENQWIRELFTLWINGDARHIPVQLERGKQILELLLSYPTPIPVLSRVNGLGKGCVVYGDAHRSGRAPTIFQVMNDVVTSLMKGREDLIIVNVITSEVVHSSTPNIIAQLHQQTSALAKDDWSHFNFSSTYLSVLDAPSQDDEGSLACGWRSNPFDNETENVLGRIGNTWTFPGTITFMHMDGVGCGMNMVHWRGSKLWMVWPGTDHNLDTLQSMGSLRPVTDFNTVLILMRRLKGIELLWVTDDDVKEKELGFYLGLNAIHACMTFTESLHAGHAVRGTLLTENLEDIVQWYTNFVTEDLLTRHGEYSADNKGVVLDIFATLDVWEDVSSQMGTGRGKKRKRTELDKMIKEARRRLTPAQAILSSSSM